MRERETFTVVFEEGETLAASLETALERGVQPYRGPDRVLPGPEDRILPTGGKRVSSDITVQKIQYAEVINPSGGTTIIIGG